MARAVSTALLSYSRKRDRIPSAAIRPALLDVKARILEKTANGLVCELIAVLGMNAFPFREMKVKIRCRDAYALFFCSSEARPEPRMKNKCPS